jgi:ATP synthase protein I
MAFLRKSDAAMVRMAYDLSAGVLSFVVALGIGWWVGRTLDRWIGTTPWMAVVFSLLGLAAGALNVVRTLSRALNEDRPAAPGRSQPGGGPPAREPAPGSNSDVRSRAGDPDRE